MMGRIEGSSVASDFVTPRFLTMRSRGLRDDALEGLDCLEGWEGCLEAISC